METWTMESDCPGNGGGKNLTPSMVTNLAIQHRSGPHTGMLIHYFHSFNFSKGFFNQSVHVDRNKYSRKSMKIFALIL
jgi:hypothetical protein